MKKWIFHINRVLLLVVGGIWFLLSIHLISDGVIRGVIIGSRVGAVIVLSGLLLPWIAWARLGGQDGKS